MRREANDRIEHISIPSDFATSRRVERQPTRSEVDYNWHITSHHDIPIDYQVCSKCVFKNYTKITIRTKLIVELIKMEMITVDESFRIVYIHGINLT